MKCLFTIFLLTSFALAGTGKITGTVRDRNGLPVPNMTVEACPLDVGISGGLPHAKTDDQGNFSLTVPTGTDAKGHPYGQRWAVYPHQEKGDYYPDLSSRFFATSENQAQPIELSASKPVANVDLELGPKAGVLVGQVTDAVSGAPVEPEFQLAWASDPKNEMGESTGDHYRLLLPPNVDITLTVVARGYKPWTYPGNVNIGPGQDMRFDIKMEPTTAETR
jgi:hypothetical protein